MRRLVPADRRVLSGSFPCSTLGIFVLWFYSSLGAQHHFTQEELRALPRVCHAQKTIHYSLDRPIVSETERAEWERRLGPDDFLHYHHYCHALIFVRRANHSSSPEERTFNLGNAVGNFEYVQRNASSAFRLMPEVNLQKGLALRLMKRDAEAAREFLGAIRLKQDYTPAYVALIDYYLDLGEIEEARSVLQTGLEHAPYSKMLESKKLQIEALPSSTKR